MSKIVRVSDHRLRRAIPWCNPTGVTTSNFRALPYFFRGRNGKRKKLFQIWEYEVKTNGFVERVQSWWSWYSSQGKPYFVLAKKLKALMEDIHWWNIREFGNVGVNNNRLEELVRLDEKNGINGLTLAKKRERDGVTSEVNQLALMEEISLRQNLEFYGLRREIRKFFHLMANSHRRNNHLGNLDVDFVVYEEEP